MSRNGTDDHLFREPIETSKLKDGAEIAVIPQIARRM
jgi:hypothetical protein